MSPENSARDDEMRPEYDFSRAVRGKHYEAYRAGTNVVLVSHQVQRDEPQQPIQFSVQASLK